jgi:hypothetical protein
MIEQDLELNPIVEMRVIFSEKIIKRGFLWRRTINLRSGMRFEARRAFSSEWFDIPFLLETLEEEIE